MNIQKLLKKRISVKEVEGFQMEKPTKSSTQKVRRKQTRHQWKPKGRKPVSAGKRGRTAQAAHGRNMSGNTQASGGKRKSVHA